MYKKTKILLSVVLLALFLAAQVNATPVDPRAYSIPSYGEASYPDDPHEGGSPVGDLTDGVYGGENYYESTWVGLDFRCTINPAVITFDFGEPIDFKTITVGYNNATWAGISVPSLTEIRFSNDGLTYTEPVLYPFIQDVDPAVHRVSLDVQGKQGRYVQLTAWQGLDGEYGFPWIFIDEVDFEAKDPDLNGGLVAWYPFNGKASDESANGNNGTVYGVTLTEDRFGNPYSAYNFDGIDDYIDISTAATDVKELHAITISLWIKPTIVGDIYPKMVLSLRNDLENARPRVGICYGELNGGDSGIYYEAVGESPDEFTINEPYSLFEVWSNIVITADDMTTKIYINGAERESGSGNRAPGDFPNSFSQFRIGRLCNTYYDFPFKGSIDDIRIYNRALSGYEIRALYGAGGFNVYPGQSIQAAINIASNGDIIVINPGTYTENINFSGKAITLKSTDPNDPSVVAATMIDGGQAGSVVTFNHSEGSDCVLDGITVQNGRAGVYGGGIYCYSSSPTITHCIISQNWAVEGGGISCYPESSPMITNCTISQNSADYGGGLACSSNSSPTLINCVITENSGSFSYGGGGVLCYSSSPTMINCTLSRNSANYGGAISCYDSWPTIKNCILWNDSPDEIYGSGSGPEVTYSDIQGGYPGLGNINGDPLFVNAEATGSPLAGDYRLKSGSPCINFATGDGAPPLDKDNRPRPIGAGYDMGAYESASGDAGGGALANGFIIALDDDGRLYYVKSNGNGSFSDFRCMASLYGGNCRGVTIGDFDDDGDFDFVAGRGIGDIAYFSLFINDGTGAPLASDHFINSGVVGTLSSANSWAMDMASGDFNNDGYMDFIANGNYWNTGLYLGDGQGSFLKIEMNLGNYYGRGLAAADFNHDGNLDFARAAYYYGGTSVYPGNGDGTFGSPVLVGTTGDDPYGLAAADFDHDGRVDLIVNSGGGGDPYFFKGRGDGTFISQGYIDSLNFDNYGAYDAYDLNSDGLADIVAVDHSWRGIWFYPGRVDGSFGDRLQIGATIGAVLGVSTQPYHLVGTPQARIEPKEQSIPLGGTAHFDGSQSDDSDNKDGAGNITGTITSWEWTFGDGGSDGGSGATASHTYGSDEAANEGTYRAGLTVTDNDTMKDRAWAVVKVLGNPPVARAGGPYQVGEDAARSGIYPVTFDGSGSSDAGGIVRYTWDFGDGWSDNFDDGQADDGGPAGRWSPIDGTWEVNDGALRQTDISLDRAAIAAGSYASGDYTIEVDVSLVEGEGQEAIIAFRATRSPLATDKNNSYAFILRGRGYNDVGLYRRVDGSLSCITSYNLPFTVTLNTVYHMKAEVAGNEIKLYLNGSLVIQATDDNLTHGRIVLATYRSHVRFDNLVVSSKAEGVNPTHTYGAGNYTTTLTVTDKAGQSATDSAQVTVTPGAPPVADAGGPYQFGEEVAREGRFIVTLDGSNSSDDVGIYRYRWDFGDGTTRNTFIEDFRAAGIDHTWWITSGAVYDAQNEMLTLSSGGWWWGSGYCFSQENFQREESITFTCRMRCRSGGNLMWGLKDTSTDYGYGRMPYAIYLAGGYWYIYEDGSQRGGVGNFNYDQWYDLKIVLKAGQGATYYYKASDQTEWIMLYDSDYATATTMFKVGCTLNDGTFDMDDVCAGIGAGIGAGGMITHSYAAAGTYQVSMTVTDHALQENTSQTTVTITNGNPPLANAGGPYQFGEETASEGQFIVTLDGSNSSDDFGIYTYRWDFGDAFTEDFAGTTIDQSRWITSGAMQGEMLTLSGTGSWGSSYCFSQRDFKREENTFTGRIRCLSGGNLMWGVKDTSDDYGYWRMPYALYLSNGNFYIYEDGSGRGWFGSFNYGQWYDLKIVLKPGQGATYYYKESDQIGTGSPLAAEWIRLYDSDYATGTTLFKAGCTVADGVFDLDDISVDSISFGPQVTHTYAAAGTYQVSLTVTDNANQVNTDQTTVTIALSGNLPVADAGGPYTVDEAAACGGRWQVHFDGSNSSDEHGIYRYEWDFDASDGFQTPDELAVEATGDRPSHFYSIPGTYTVTLRVYSQSLQMAEATTTVTVEANSPPVADAGGPYQFGEEVARDGQFVVILDGSKSTDDFGIYTYQWDFGDGTTEGRQVLIGDFRGTAIDQALWITSGATQDEHEEMLTLNGAWWWGSSYCFSQNDFKREEKTFTGRIRCLSGGNLMWGVKNTSTSYDYGQMPYAIYLCYGSLYIYEDGSNGTYVGSFSYGQWYDLKIVLKPVQGATYYYKASDQTEWIMLYDSDHATATTLFKVGCTLYSGTFDMDDIYAGTGFEAQINHTYAVAGTYQVSLTVTDHANQQDISYTTVTIANGNPPVAEAGGPYQLGEEVARGGQFIATFDGSNSTDDFGIYTYRWDFGDIFTEDFAGTAGTNIDQARWITSGATQDDMLTLSGTGGWGSGYCFSRNNFRREGGATFTGRMRCQSGGSLMWGVKNTSTNYDYGQMPYAIYLADGYWYVYEDGSSRGQFGNFTYGQWYDLKIVLKPVQGATYYYRASDQTEWTVLYDSDYATAATWLKAGCTVAGGTFDMDDISVKSIGLGPQVTHGYAAAGTYQVTLTVTDRANQTNTDSATVSITKGNPPLADAGGPYQFGEESARDGQFIATFDGTKSTDDFGIYTYRWDFGDGSSGYSGWLARSVTIYDGYDVYEGYGGYGWYGGYGEMITLNGAWWWGSSYCFSQEEFTRKGEETAFTARMRCQSGGDLMWGLKNTSTNYDCGQMPYAIYFSYGNLYIYEDGSQRGWVGSFSNSQWYDLKIVLKPVQGATYYYKPSDQIGTGAQAFLGALDELSAEWIRLYDSDYATAATLFKVGCTVHGGSFDMDDVRVDDIDFEAKTTHSYAAEGTYQIGLTVADHALQENIGHTTLTLTKGNPPIADAGKPYAGKGNNPVRFNGQGSTDDTNISRYAWDFGDGQTGEGVSVSHAYSHPGTYTVTLTVYDNLLQSSTDQTSAEIAPGTKILGIDTGSGWDYSIVSYLSGIVFTEVSTAEFATVDLDLYDVLLVSETFTDGGVTAASQATLNALKTREADLENWINAGHGVVALSEPIGEGRFSWLPDTVQPTVGLMIQQDAVTIVNPGHPVMAGLTSEGLSGWGGSSHGNFTDRGGLNVLVTDGGMRPITLAGIYGSGKIVMSDQDPALHAPSGTPEQAVLFLQNAIDWVSAPGGGDGEDTIPPEDVTNLQVQCFDTRLSFTWDHSANIRKDLAGYKVYFNNAADSGAGVEGIILPASQNSYEAVDLAAAAAYPIRITAFDFNGNESSGLSMTAITLLDNPATVSVSTYSGVVNLNWSAVEPAQYLKHYAVYVSQTDFSSIEGMTPRLTTTQTSARISGLMNKVTYYLAVAAVNLSSGKKKEVTTVSATPTADTQGPEISEVRLNDSSLQDGAVLHDSGTFTLSAIDPARLSRVEFSFDGHLYRTDSNGSSSYSCFWDIIPVQDGDHTLTITAYDTLGNSASVTYQLVVDLDPPSAPVITQPASGSFVNTHTITVSGQANKFTEIILYINGQETGNPAAVDAYGNFSLTATLVEGENRIQAAARNRGGTSPKSQEVLITVDSNLPQSPVNLSAQAKAGGVIRLAWQQPQEPSLKGYYLYRASNMFTSPAQATRVGSGSGPISGTSFDDTPPADGTYYYRVSTVDTADNESLLSEYAQATSDGTLPKATSIRYSPTGAYDQATDGSPAGRRMGRGRVDLVLTVSEPLLTAPFLSITPEAGIPIAVELTKMADSDGGAGSHSEYSGFFMISEDMPAGVAYAVFSARDLVGNRGTDIDAGSSILIDARGPAITMITLQPGAPIKNDENSPVSVTVTIGLDEAMKPGETPQLSYILSGLSGEARSAVSITPLTLIGTQPPEGIPSGQIQTWQATFLLPDDAGLTKTETLTFTYSGVDDLDNVSSRILPSAANQFQVYQGSLPPLESPLDFKGESLPGGRIRLSWHETGAPPAVEAAAGYQLYRQAPGESELTAYQRLGQVVEFTDVLSSDGLYSYAIASIRQENGQESLSKMSGTISLESDSTPPGTPWNLVLELVGNGIKASWEAPAGSGAEQITYSLYRANSNDITSVEGLTPVVKGIPHIPQTMTPAPQTVVDPYPSLTDHCYAVTAVDKVGNESAPSNSYYLNFSLLPVSSLNVRQEENNAPVVSWTYLNGTMAGYNLYLGPEGQRSKLNQNLLTDLAYTDTGYTGNERQYTVTAIDQNGHESLGRSLVLPILRATLQESVPGSVQVRRGLMNRLEYLVENHSAAKAGAPLAVEHIKVKAAIGQAQVPAPTVDTYDHTSEEFSLEAGASRVVAVIVGGYADLPDLSALTTTIKVAPGEGEKVEIIRHTQVKVGPGMLTLGILNEEFTRGGVGKVRFTLENTGGEEIEITTATGSGSAPSSEILFSLLDADGNVLSSVPFKQALGDKVTTLANGNTVARIPAGSTFTSDLVEIPVPSSAPNEVTIQLAMARIYYHQGKPDQVIMDGLSSRRQISLVDTSYYGEALTVTPEISNGDQDIVITGRAVERNSGSPMPKVPLNLILSVNGFERKVKVFTDEAGAFSSVFTPTPGESGLYKVCAIHPDLFDRPVQKQFVINRISINPGLINLSIPRNYQKTISIGVTAGSGTTVNNVKLVYDETDQPEGMFPTGVQVEIGNPVVAIGSEQTAYLDFTIWADNSTEETGQVILKVVSDEAETSGWGLVTINTYFSEARPALYFSPDHVETGMALGETANESIVLENKGTSDLNEVALAIVWQDEAKTPAPAWVHLNAAANQGAIQVGEKLEISISFSPVAGSTQEGIYSFYLKVTSSNYQTTYIGLYASVTQSGLGNALFKVSDIYTGTVNSNHEIIQGLAGAQVKVQNEAVVSVEQTKTTDSLGEVLFSDLPTGRYKCRITADNHQEYIGSLWIKPGMTANKEVFLEYNLVTVEWEVTETTIQDKYEIVLKATYETNVPAPVVVAEPASIPLPDMMPGDVFTGEITFTNYGLIRAQNLDFQVPKDDQYFKYEVLGEIPKNLEAKERITVPYRVTCLTSLTAQNGGGGGTCYNYYSVCFHLGYEWVCINGVWQWASVSVCFTKAVGYECEGGGGGGGGYVYIGGGWGGWGGGSSGGGPSGETISGILCPPPLPCPRNDECYCYNMGMGGDEPTGSSVNLFRGEYTDHVVDLSIKMPGAPLEVERRYYDDDWHFRVSDEEQKLEFIYGVDQTSPDYINKDGVKYITTDAQRKVFSFGSDRYIFVTEDGYRWEDKSGNWSKYDVKGRLISYGTRTGVKAIITYESGENGKLTGVTDSSGSQLLWYEYNSEGKVSSVHDASGRRVEYYYESGKLSKFVDLLGNETLYRYNAEGKLISKQYPAGRITNISYNKFGYVASVTGEDDPGVSFNYSYDSGKKEYYAQVKYGSGKIKEVWFNRFGKKILTDINGNTAEKVVYYGRDKSMVDGSGNQTYKEYDERGNLTRETYPDGSTVSYEYEAKFSNVVKKVDERGVVTRYRYDDSGNMIKKIEAAGTPTEQVTEYTYDADGNLLTEKKLGDGNTAEAITIMEYDKSGNMTSTTDSEGNTTRFTYDIIGNVLTKEDARGKVWSYEYDAMGRLLSTTDPLGNVSRSVYDKAGNKVKEIDAEGKETTYEYDHKSNVIRKTDSSGNSTLYEYNTDGKMTKQTDPEGKELRYEYDQDGRLVKTIDGNGNKVVMEYGEASGSSCSSCSSGNSAGKPVKVTYPTYTKEYGYDKRGRKTEEMDVLGTGEGTHEEYSTQFVYDLAGNQIAETDKEGKTTTYRYDELNRLVKEIDALGHATEYTYDDRNNRTTVKDANGNVTRFQYDRNNRVIKETRPMVQETAYQYDQVGNLILKIDAKNQRSEYAYDDAGRKIEVRYFSASNHDTPVKTVRFSYDKIGNLKGYDDGATSGEYIYDKLRRKTSEKVDYGPFELSYSYTYYKNGKKKSFTGPDGITYQYTYDSNGQLASILIPGQGYVTYNSYIWNEPGGITLPGGTRREYTYDPLMRIKSIKVKDPAGGIILNYQYTYDRMNTILSQEIQGGIYVYEYDDLSRLINVKGPVWGEEAFTYDSVGNRVSASSVPGTWEYNINNSLLSYGGVSLQYDENGNTIAKIEDGNTLAYIYDIENRLIRVEDAEGGVIASYYYDPFGRRLWKKVKDVMTYFLYSDEGLVGEYNLSGNITKSYGYMPQHSKSTTLPLFQKVGEIYYWYQNDHLGTPQKLIDTNGRIVWSASYYAFGKTQIEADEIENNIGFPGQYYDKETGLHYNHYRYYDHEIGRYLQPDPIGFDGGVNLFTYVHNNPENWVDPTGLAPEKFCGSGWNKPFVPDEPFGYNFSSACKWHDDCYSSKCGVSKTACDAGFLHLMLRECNKRGRWDLGRYTCIDVAYTYHHAVALIGLIYYYEAQKKACCEPNPDSGFNPNYYKGYLGCI